jgi:hypothetical protein
MQKGALIFPLFFFCLLMLIPMDVSQAQTNQFDYERAIRAIDMEAIKAHVLFFSSLGTRATGYRGNEEASQYIYKRFLEYGLVNVSFHEFPVVDAIDYGSNITIMSSGETLQIYPLLPNLVATSSTPPEGITGSLIYVGRGELSEFNGKPVIGSIVLMDYNSDDNWLNAAKLGARAVIFLHPERLLPQQSFYRAEKYLALTPLSFPRFYADRETSARLLQNLNQTVLLRASQVWKRMTGRNVIGIVRGTEKPNQYVALTSYYDSYSLCPSIAPGAQEAIGVSVLLEMAKYLSKNPPRYSVLFIAFGGHHQTLAGSTWYVHDFLFPGVDPWWSSFGDRVLWQLNLDLSTSSKTVYLTGVPAPYTAGYFKVEYYPMEPYFTKQLERINQRKPMGRTYDVLLWLAQSGAPM